MAVGFPLSVLLLLCGFLSVANVCCDPATDHQGFIQSHFLANGSTMPKDIVIFQVDPGPYAYLAMSALGFTNADGDRVRRRLEMNWFGVEDYAGARVQLYYGSPDGDVLVDTSVQNFPDGYITTEIELPTLTMEELGWAYGVISGYLFGPYSMIELCKFLQTMNFGS